MRAYLAVAGGSSGRVPVESKTEVYRDPGDTQEVFAATGDRVHNLGVADPTVSRKTDGRAPIVLAARPDCIEIKNVDNTNGVTVRVTGDERQINAGRVARVRHDADIDIGYRTELTLTVERDPTVEFEGDYVAGDKVENSTEIVDSVVNRADVSAGSSDVKSSANHSDRTVVEDSVVNRSNVSGSSDAPQADDSARSDRSNGRIPEGPNDGDSGSETTQEFCEAHQRTYTGTCPECAQNQRSDGDASFCIHCGDEIPTEGRLCSECGAEL